MTALAHAAVVVSIDKDVIDLVIGENLFSVLGVFDPSAITKVCGIPVLGPDSAWPKWSEFNPNAKAILAIDPPGLRQNLSRFYGETRLATVIASSAYISPMAKIGRGSIIQRGAYISADVEIGMAVKVNIGAYVHHDCQIGDFATLAPGCRILGSVSVANCAYIGAAATILPGRRVGAGAIVGAGAVVADDIADGVSVAGVPARPMPKKA